MAFNLPNYQITHLPNSIRNTEKLGNLHVFSNFSKSFLEHLSPWGAVEL